MTEPQPHNGDRRVRTLETQLARLEERLVASEKAKEIQASEYARRLHDLNGEYERDRKRQADYVTVDKYEDKLNAEAEAREAALLRVDEKFEDYVKRYEQRQREVDLALTVQKTAAVEAQRFAEQQGFKANRNIALLGVVLGAVVILMNLVGLA